MDKIRDLFHKIGNLHNKISIAAGISKAELKKGEIKTVAARLSEMERTAVEAGSSLRKLKDLIYKEGGLDG